MPSADVMRSIGSDFKMGNFCVAIRKPFWRIDRGAVEPKDGKGASIRPELFETPLVAILPHSVKELDMDEGVFGLDFLYQDGPWVDVETIPG